MRVVPSLKVYLIGRSESVLGLWLVWMSGMESCVELAHLYCRQPGLGVRGGLCQHSRVNVLIPEGGL